MDDLDGRVYVITGAARGIGAETARRLSGAGAHVALLGLEPAELEAVARSCGQNALALETDVTDVESLERAVEQVVDRWGGIDGLIANAGIASAGFVRSIDPDAFERVIEVNLLGAWRTVRACLPSIVQRRGYVLVVASLAAVAHGPAMSAYAASKAGIEAFSNSLRAEVAHLGVDVGVAYFSWIATDMVAGGDEHPVFGSLRSELKGPMGRTYPVSDAAEAILDGVMRRSRAVFAPPWIRFLLPLRGLIPWLARRQMGKQVPSADARALQDVIDRGADASAPVGAGGRADRAAAAS